MSRFSHWRSAAILILAAGLSTGCLPYGAGVVVSSDRAVARPAAPPPPPSAHLYNRVDRDAIAYTRQISRAVRLAPRQQRVVHDLLAQRAFHHLDRLHPRNHGYLYPFPRRAGERERVVQRFWRDADRAIERHLNPMQRRAYRDFVRYHYADGHRAPGRRGHGRR